jgi:hypothetical protein
MMNPPTPAPWTAPAAAPPLVRAAFATLERPQQRLLEAMVFDGRSCTRLAQSLGASATYVRQHAGAAMLALHEALAAPRGSRGADRGGAVAVMLALRALDALDPDEAELVDAMLLHHPALQRVYDDHVALVGELCEMVPRAAPSLRVLARLLCATGDDGATN